MKQPFDKNADYQPSEFNFRDEGRVKEILSRYPEGRERSAVMPLLDLAQRQVAEDGSKADPPYGGWIPAAAIQEIARITGESEINVLEVASFYTMFNLSPVGKYLVQVCSTTPCWLRGSDNIMSACQKHLGIKTGQTTEDGMFTLKEVECLGACVNAPVVQINDEYYEDLDEEGIRSILIKVRDER
jgi:NADH-quinone oxidoreductase subunit E